MRQADRQTDRQTDRETDRETDRQGDMETGRQTDRQTVRQIAVHTLMEVKLSMKAARGSPAAARLVALCPNKLASSARSQMSKAYAALNTSKSNVQCVMCLTSYTTQYRSCLHTA